MANAILLSIYGSRRLGLLSVGCHLANFMFDFSLEVITLPKRNTVGRGYALHEWEAKAANTTFLSGYHELTSVEGYLARKYLGWFLGCLGKLGNTSVDTWKRYWC
jgi:hypothetical protein